jgi:hypothetical protein
MAVSRHDPHRGTAARTSVPGARRHRSVAALMRGVFWRAEVRRCVALGAALLFNFAALFLLLRPVVPERVDAHRHHGSRDALRQRFVPIAVSPEVQASARPPRRIAPARQRHPVRPTLPLQTALAGHPQPVVSPWSAPSLPVRPTTDVDRPVIPEDGGFDRRLREAQHADAIRGVPGSPTPRVAGIQFVDPQTQGLRGAMRQMQRLFGITNHHCVDVDVWRHLSPRELAARFISPRDVDRVDAANHCNQPPGRHF